jgi:hypothetical protein
MYKLKTKVEMEVEMLCNKPSRQTRTIKTNAWH